MFCILAYRENNYMTHLTEGQKNLLSSIGMVDEVLHFPLMSGKGVVATVVVEQG